MPSIITHHIFSEEIHKKMNKKDKELISSAIDVYHAFAQSHDYLYYYTFAKDCHKIKDLGNTGHKRKTQEYFINMINNIKEMSLTNDSFALAYLYGSLTHYVMDSTCHPFIFYKTGACNSDDPNTYKYRGGHGMMEKSIDAIYYKKYYGKEYKYCNVPKHIIGKPIFTDKLYKLIDKTWKDTYDEENMGSKYFKGIKDAKIIYYLAINDRFGIKRLIYKFLDLLTDHKHSYEYYSTHITNPNINLLNLERKEWTNPANNNLKFTSSFEDLFEEGITKVLNIINTIHLYFEDKINEKELRKMIPDLSYSNGLLLKDYKPMQYFEY